MVVIGASINVNILMALAIVSSVIITDAGSHNKVSAVTLSTLPEKRPIWTLPGRDSILLIGKAAITLVVFPRPWCRTIAGRGVCKAAD